MIRLSAIGFVAAAVWVSQPAAAQDVAVPSGVPMRLFEVVMEQNPATARFRFVSAAIDPAGQGLGFEDLLPDLQYLCDSVAKPALAQSGWIAGDVVLSVSDRETVFGERDPDATQFFQPFRIADDTCIWEDF